MSKSLTLLEKAKSAGVGRKMRMNYTDEHLALAFAWLKDEISMGQGAIALGGKASGNVLYMFATALKKAYREGKLVIK